MVVVPIVGYGGWDVEVTMMVVALVCCDGSGINYGYGGDGGSGGIDGYDISGGDGRDGSGVITVVVVVVMTMVG